MRTLSFITLWLGLSLAVQGQEPYSLKSCIETGLEQNYLLRIVRNEEQMARNNATRGNAGMLPTVDLTAGYSGNVDNTKSIARADGTAEHNAGLYAGNVNVGVDLNWTIFDGFSIITEYQILKELEKQGETLTRIAIEDYIAQLSSEYYNYIQQEIRLKNFLYAVSLSKERLRIVEERYQIGNFSRLDLLQARVDFNADSAQYMKQQETLHSSRIRLNELMAIADMSNPIAVVDTVIDVNTMLVFEELWTSTLQTNASLLKAEQDKTIANLDLKKVFSRNYPYVRLNAGYGYTLNTYDRTNTTRRRNNLGANFGITLGFNIYDGNRRREIRNARIAAQNAELQQKDIVQSLRADISNLWQAYKNNIEVLNLERENLTAAKENYLIARERYILGNLSGIELREAQKSLLDAEERILTAEYDTKLCEISLLQISGKITDYLL